MSLRNQFRSCVSPVGLVIVVAIATVLLPHSAFGLVELTPAGFSDIEVEPTDLTIDVPQGQTGTTNLLVKNVGSGVLVVYSIENDADWLSEDPSNFEVPSNGAQSVTVTVDATGLQEGIYNQSMSIESNDEDEGTVIVPIAVTVTESVGINDSPHGMPSDLWLTTPLPNPSRGAMRFRFNLPDERPVRLGVFNLGGQEVSVLHDAVLSAGIHEVNWSGTIRNGQPVNPGVYFARLESDGQARVVPVLRLR